MTNAEFYHKPEDLKKAHEAFRKLTKDMLHMDWVRRAVEDPYFYATKWADTALKPGLSIGSLVKIMTNLQGEGLHPHYAVVAAIHVDDCGEEYVKCNRVTLRFANGSSYSYKVEKKIGTPVSDESQMKQDDIKACDIPAELLGLALENCPLKNEGACMKGAR